MADILRDLGDGLVLRHATPDDTEALADFNARMHGSPDGTEPNQPIATWVRDLMRDDHPTFRVRDFLVVENTATGAIVSSVNHISQTWSYAGIPFKVGRPELVGTEKAFRHRGLVRVQFDILHQWSAERGELVQAITGIPFYYRQFGYEMTVNLGGSRLGYGLHVPKLKAGASEPFVVRPAVEGDLPFIAALYDRAAARNLLWCLRDEAMWRFELVGHSEDSTNRRQLCLIETPEGEPVGFLAHAMQLWGQAVGATMFEVKPGVSWASVTPSVVRFLWQAGTEIAARTGKEDALGAFAFGFGERHPAYEVFNENLPRTWEPYAWYLRVPDLPAFVLHIAPALDARLAASPLAGHTGETQLSFYRAGLRLRWEQGRLVEAEAWQPSHEAQGHAGFPNHAFLHLLFGHRTLAELRHLYADCWADDDARPLLAILFPKQVSDVWPIS